MNLENDKRVAPKEEEQPKEKKRLGAGMKYCQFDSFVLKDEADDIEGLFGYSE